MSTKASHKKRSEQLRPMFIQWCAALRDKMFATGKGYRRYPLRNTGRGTDRRHDKLMDGGLDEKGQAVLIPFSPPEGKIKRQARLGTIGIRH